MEMTLTMKLIRDVRRNYFSDNRSKSNTECSILSNSRVAFVSFVLLDDVVYQQTGVGGATLDKRRPDLRDELGYIAPPNRKLPPVPGSNYNTCDRIKRGTVISKPQLPTI